MNHEHTVFSKSILTEIVSLNLYHILTYCNTEMWLIKYLMWSWHKPPVHQCSNEVILIGKIKSTLTMWICLCTAESTLLFSMMTKLHCFGRQSIVTLQLSIFYNLSILMFNTNHTQHLKQCVTCLIFSPSLKLV